MSGGDEVLWARGCTYCTICDAEKGKEHVVVSLGHQFADHGLCVLRFICQGAKERMREENVASSIQRSKVLGIDRI